MPQPSGHLIVDNLENREEPRNFRDQELSGRIVLDGASFERCRFKGASLVYMGGQPPALVSCQFTDTSFQFLGAAGRTVALLQAMSGRGSGLNTVFKAAFPKVFAH